MPTRGKAKDRKVAEAKASYAQEMANLTPAALSRKLKQLEEKMHEHAKNLEFEKAAQMRDQLSRLKAKFFGSDGGANVVPFVAEKAA